MSANQDGDGVRILSFEEYADDVLLSPDPEDFSESREGIIEGCRQSWCVIRGCPNRAALIKMRENTYFLCSRHRNSNARNLDARTRGVSRYEELGVSLEMPLERPFSIRLPGSYGTGKRG